MPGPTVSPTEINVPFSPPPNSDTNFTDYGYKPIDNAPLNPPSPPTPNPITPQTNPGLPGVVPYQLPDGSTIMIPAGTVGATPPSPQ